jgi:hypothetical protein
LTADAGMIPKRLGIHSAISPDCIAVTVPPPLVPQPPGTLPPTKFTVIDQAMALVGIHIDIVANKMLRRRRTSRLFIRVS